LHGDEENPSIHNVNQFHMTIDTMPRNGRIYRFKHDPTTFVRNNKTVENLTVFYQNGEIHLSNFTAPTADFQLYSTTGQVVKSGTTQNEVITVNSLTPGVYFLRLSSSNNSTTTTKIIVN
jgi:hypothetical protein